MHQGAPIKITDVVIYNGWGGYFFEDLEKIREHAIPVSERYHTPTGHNRYPFVRTPAPVLGIGLKLDNGSTFWGDAVAVSFGGKSGRAGPGTPQALELSVTNQIGPWFKGRTISSWLELERPFLRDFSSTPAFVRYAISQALVGAVSSVRGETPYRLMAKELSLPILYDIIPLHGSSGADWGGAVDRMLARGLTFLPQGQFENIPDQIGADGHNLLAWVRDFKKRALKFAYVPTLTLDFHGALDAVFDRDNLKIANYISTLAHEAKPHSLHIESPIVGKTLAEHAARFSEIRALVKTKSPDVRIVADEWANEVSDIEYLIKNNAVDGIHIKMPDTGSLSECARAVKVCRASGVFALLGGSCTETDIGARMSAHLALATRPDAMLIKPGMGFDESYALMFNEMARSVL